jgi:hypothetical protein
MMTRESVKNHDCLFYRLVTPAEAGVQLVYLIVLMAIRGRYWIPAFAGMTAWEPTNTAG